MWPIQTVSAATRTKRMLLLRAADSTRCMLLLWTADSIVYVINHSLNWFHFMDLCTFCIFNDDWQQCWKREKTCMSDERLLRTSQNCTCHFFANSFSNATSHNDHLFKKMDPSKGAWQEEKGTIEIPFIPLYLFTIVLNLLS